jgi:hypothetical protein
MNIVQLTSQGLRIQTGYMRRRRENLTPTECGTEVRLGFPWTARTLGELDAWLTEHPRAKCIQLPALPSNRHALQGLTTLIDKHNVVMVVSPRRADGSPRGTHHA